MNIAAEEELIHVLRDAGSDLYLTLPCDRVKCLIGLLERMPGHLPLTREEEGVGIAAGAAMAGGRPVMVLQSSGLGNMLNALLSLTAFYKLPLPLFISRRGIFKEGIAAQVPMGEKLPAILDAAGIGWVEIGDQERFSIIPRILDDVYREGKIFAFLLSPAIWEGSSPGMGASRPDRGRKCAIGRDVVSPTDDVTPTDLLTRYEVIGAIRDFLKDQVVVANLGVPSKELHAVLPQPSNFYMLGSMGMVSPIGLGVAISYPGRVFVLDGDGSLLMNPGTLATAAWASPKNLTILAVDNGAYGSTGNQPTLTGRCVDLGTVARGFGIVDTVRAASVEKIREAILRPQDGPRFVHILARPHNEPAPNVSLGHIEVRDRFTEFLKGRAI